MTVTVATLGFPRIGPKRELKTALESYWSGKSDAGALLATAAGQNPLNRIFSYRYHVTGTWSDPQVNRAGAIAEPGPEEEK